MKKTWVKLSLLLVMGFCVSSVVVLKYIESKEKPQEVLEGYYVTKDEDFSFDKYLTAGKPVLIDYKADWCEPCKIFDPTLKQVKDELGDKAIIRVVNVEERPDLAEKIPLKVIPSQVLFSADGKPFNPVNSKLGKARFAVYSKNGSGELDLTMHQGIMTKEELLTLFKEMGMA